jgi:outer membrane protein OmpA-like peptidoglycan-associated protein
MLKLNRFSLAVLLMIFAIPVLGQDTPPPSQDQSLQIANQGQAPPVYRVNVVERTTQAIDYVHKGKKLTVDLVGTSLMPDARGKATVEPHTGRIKIDVDFKKMKPAQTYGPQYLTYVLWAITPEGRPVNLGEVVLRNKKDTDSNLHVTSNLQTFGMIVTAEPYFSVTRPSDVTVMQNQIGPDLKADVTPISTHYEALGRSEYSVDIAPTSLPSTSADEKMPLDLLEAQNAVAIAKASGADQYAASSMQSAQAQLTASENAYRQKKGDAAIGTPARQAVQTAEDARLLTIRKKNQERIAQEQAEARRRTEEARARADAAAKRAEEARLQAERDTQQRQQAEAAQKQAEAAAQQAEQARQEAMAQQQQLAQQTQQARVQAQQAEAARQQAERQTQETRQRLLAQLNSVLQTRESARGLIVNMSDVLFDTGKATLKPGARERLAKVAGIIMAYPDLKLQVEGHTDSVGGDAYNQGLSERRADAVKAYLENQGVPDADIVARGYGKSEPIASNETASGRQLNRRVELVVSGTAIGQTQVPNTGATPAQSSSQPGAVAAPPTTNKIPQ